MTNRPADPTITRTFRAAAKVGDDYYTVEETICLPPNATDDLIMEAVQTGLRIYDAQRLAVLEQIGQLRAEAGQRIMNGNGNGMREPDAPASDKQRAYMDRLLHDLNWTHDRLTAYAAERNLNLLTLTKREASELIDELKGIADGRVPAPHYDAPPTPLEQAVEDAEPDLFDEPPVRVQQPAGERATERQIRALMRLVDERGIDIMAELKQRFGERTIDQLSMDEAGNLLSEWQQRPRVVRRHA